MAGGGEAGEGVEGGVSRMRGWREGGRGKQGRGWREGGRGEQGEGVEGGVSTGRGERGWRGTLVSC